MTKTIDTIGEFALIERIRQLVPDDDARVVLAIGDDAAILKTRADRLVLATSDIQIEGTHFNRIHASPWQIGWRAMAVNLSDIAAMGGIPRFALISLALPSSLTNREFDDLYQGFIDAARRFGVTIVGGNLAQSSDKMIIDVTLLGEAEETRLLRRDGAHPGDTIYVSGQIGASALGHIILKELPEEDRHRFKHLVKAHLEPKPRIELGRLISQHSLATAMIDVSDGLAQDLDHICKASRVGAVLHWQNIPVPVELNEIATSTTMNPEKIVLGGGEDYELLFAVPNSVPEERVQKIAKKSCVRLARIGEIIAPPGLFLETTSAGRQPLTITGWDHFRVGTEK